MSKSKAEKPANLTGNVPSAKQPEGWVVLLRETRESGEGKTVEVSIVDEGPYRYARAAAQEAERRSKVKIPEGWERDFRIVELNAIFDSKADRFDKHIDDLLPAEELAINAVLDGYDLFGVPVDPREALERLATSLREYWEERIEEEVANSDLG